MAGQYKTRCPHCGAQFKISDDHLGQARGAVRCGSCLQIFQATDHLLGDTPPAPAEQPWQYPLDQDQQATPEQAGEALELSDSFLSLDRDGPGHDDDYARLDNDQDALSGNADESWAEALLADLDDEPQPLERREPPPPAPARAKAQSDDPFAFLNATPRPRPGYHEPSEAAQSRRHGGLGAALIWTPLALVAALLLVGQYAYFHLDTLARSPQWRPLYAQACQAIGCQLPGRADLSALRGANLVVRTHPQYQHALMVDALLFNEGQWPQPFPALELTFDDLHGQPVASRRFQPAEYLHGDLATRRTLPVNTPAHVALEIVDPGKQAVSYRLRLLPAQNEAEGRPL